MIIYRVLYYRTLILHKQTLLEQHVLHYKSKNKWADWPVATKGKVENENRDYK